MKRDRSSVLDDSPERDVFDTTIIDKPSSIRDVCEFSKFRSLPHFYRLDTQERSNSIANVLRRELYAPTGARNIPFAWDFPNFGKILDMDDNHLYRMFYDSAITIYLGGTHTPWVTNL